MKNSITVLPEEWMKLVKRLVFKIKNKYNVTYFLLQPY